MLLPIYSIVYAVDSNVSVSVSQKEILLGDSVILTIKVEGMSHPTVPSIPEIPNFSVRFLGKKQESHSSYTVIINGKKVEDKKSSSGIQFDYELTPKKVGVLTIPQFSIMLEGRSYQFNTFTIKVLDQQTQRDDIFVKQFTDRSEFFLGEKISVNFKWYLRKDIKGYTLTIPWLNGLKNGVISDVDPDKNKTYQTIIVNGNQQSVALKSQEVVNGKKYTVFSIKKIITPISAGVYTLDPVFLKCNVITGYRRSGRSAFDQFFDNSRNAITHSFSTRSNDLSFTVKPPPLRNRPLSFTGAVGEFDFNLGITPKTVRVGDPITVTMKVVGVGNIEHVKMPLFPDLPEFKSYEPESKLNYYKKNGQLIGEKVFEKVLIPRVKGHSKIDKIKFTFFNPKTKLFQTVVKGPFHIHVDKSEIEDDRNDKSSHQLKFFQQNLRYIKTEWDKNSMSEKKYYENRILWGGGYLVPLCVLSIFYLVRKRRLLLRSDLKFLRNNRAEKRSRRFILVAKKAIESKDGKQFYHAINNVLTHYLAGKLNLPVARVTADIINQLKRLNVESVLIEEVASLFQSIEMSLFSSVQFNSNQIQSDFEKVKRVIKQLKRNL